ncbi:MAG: hypothetical protein LN364_02470, partial [Candidatus Thermoplasmatota archaeon]|nr:hypothetical protein [Candidatus Thermoplasmatota archaeon]
MKDSLHELLKITWGYVPSICLQIAVESGLINYVAANQPCSLDAISCALKWEDQPAREIVH